MAPNDSNSNGRSIVVKFFGTYKDLYRSEGGKCHDALNLNTSKIFSR